MHQLDRLAADLLDALRAEQAGVDRLAAQRRGSKETPPVRWSPMAGPARALGAQLLAVAQGGGDTNFQPAFGAAINDFEVKHGNSR